MPKGINKKRTRWVKALFDASKRNNMIIPNVDVSPDTLLDLSNVLNIKPLTIPDKTAVQIYRQCASEQHHLDAERLGMLSNQFGLNMSHGLSKGEQNAYNKGLTLYKSDTISKSLKLKIKKGLIKWAISLP